MSSISNHIPLLSYHLHLASNASTAALFGNNDLTFDPVFQLSYMGDNTYQSLSLRQII
jgi:hypothetical protein